MRGRAVLVAAVGIFLLAFGLLFLVGAGGQARRVVIGLACMALGAVAAGFGIRSYKRADLWSEEQVRAEILELARHRNGEVTMEDVEAALGRRVRVARRVLAEMATEGAATEGHKAGSRFFVFPDLQPRLMVRFCRYCDAEFPISDERSSCPNCGGALETRVARRSLSVGEVFAMDEGTDA